MKTATGGFTRHGDADVFDESRLSNAGKEVARAHKQLRRAATRLLVAVDEANAAGLTPRQVETALLRFCGDREQVLDAVSLFEAATTLREKGQL